MRVASGRANCTAGATRFAKKTSAECGGFFLPPFVRGAFSSAASFCAQPLRVFSTPLGAALHVDFQTFVRGHRIGEHFSCAPLFLTNSSVVLRGVMVKKNVQPDARDG